MKPGDGKGKDVHSVISALAKHIARATGLIRAFLLYSLYIPFCHSFLFLAKLLSSFSFSSF